VAVSGSARPVSAQFAFAKTLANYRDRMSAKHAVIVWREGVPNLCVYSDGREVTARDKLHARDLDLFHRSFR
jgi:hypothetical protein